MNRLPTKYNAPKITRRMRALYYYAETIREDFPAVWALGGNVRGNQSYQQLARAVRRGRFTEQDRPFIKVWRAWKARHYNHTTIRGMIASLKWLDVPAVGLRRMKAIIDREIKKRYQ